jgi:hypothetical protein
MLEKAAYPFPVEEFAEQDRTESEFAYRNRAMWFVCDLLMKSKTHHGSRKLILDVLENGEKHLKVCVNSKDCICIPL